MSRIAVCDHRSQEAVENFLTVLATRGHEPIQINNEDTEKAFEEIKAFCPDVIVLDLFFENRDASSDFQNWWGCRILKLIKSDDLTRDKIILILSKYLSSKQLEPEHRRYLVDTMDIDEKYLLGWGVSTWKEIAKKIETMIPE